MDSSVELTYSVTDDSWLGKYYLTQDNLTCYRQSNNEPFYPYANVGDFSVSFILKRVGSSPNLQPVYHLLLK